MLLRFPAISGVAVLLVGVPSPQHQPVGRPYVLLGGIPRHREKTIPATSHESKRPHIDGMSRTAKH